MPRGDSRPYRHPPTLSALLSLLSLSLPTHWQRARRPEAARWDPGVGWGWFGRVLGRLPDPPVSGHEVCRAAGGSDPVSLWVCF